MNSRTLIALVGILSASGAAAQGPAPVSPGAATASTHVGSSCPTFSWSQADQAKGYELAVYEVEEQDVLKRRVQVTLPSGTGSWTPSGSECLSSGGQYGWAVRAMTSEGTGEWSSVALFSTSGAPSEDELREALAVLRRYQDSSEVPAAESPEPPTALPGPAEYEPHEADRVTATLDGAMVDATASPAVVRDGAGFGSPPQRAVESLNGTSLSIDGDFDLEGSLLQSGVPLLHTTGTHNTAVGMDALRSNTGGTGTEGSLNTAVGWYALRDNTTGQRNTAIGEEALRRNTEGNRNTALGENTLPNNVEGNENTAVGQDSMFHNLSGEFNTAVGKSSLQENKTGDFNTAIGHGALQKAMGHNNVAVGYGALGTSTGRSNTAVGYLAGNNWTDGEYNIALGHYVSGRSGETRTIRIGQSTFVAKAFIAGIRGKATGRSDAIPVLIDSLGQLGTVSSSARYKEDIDDLGSRSAALMDLRPVEFRYKRAFADGGKPIQYGLIAEEVAQVFPELVVYNDDGEPETVKYHWLSTLLLNELQGLRAELQRQAADLRWAVANCNGARRHSWE